MKATQTPMFLNTFLENQENREKKKEVPKVILNLFNKEQINDVNYYLYTVKLEEKKKFKNKDQTKNTSTPNDTAIKSSKILSNKLNTLTKKTELEDIKEEEDSENSRLKEEENEDDEKEEILDNEDKYEVEGHGKEKAIKKMKFIHLPPVLMFQLKRFEYNNEINFIEKLNDYYKFEDELNMNNYIEKKNKNEDYKYTLFSVVVHKGNVFGGHYYAYINQDIEHKKENWFCFNDENVRKADLFEVFDLNFGGDFSIPKYN